MLVRCVFTAISVLLVTAFAALSQQQQSAWYRTRANFDQLQFDKDAYECMKEGRQVDAISNPPRFTWSTVLNPFMRKACLEERSYYLVPNPQTSSPPP